MDFDNTLAGVPPAELRDFLGRDPRLNESWIDSNRYGTFGGSATETMKQWSVFKRRNPTAKMICIDIQPYGHTQAKEQSDIINVGGFSDQAFEVIAAVASGQSDSGHWVRQIEEVVI